MTCANLLFPAPNSEVVAISLAIVFDITDILSPVVNDFVADFFAFFALLKKYLTFFLWMMSIRVPITIKSPIRITKDCINMGEILPAKIENGLLTNILKLYPFFEIFLVQMI